VITDEGGSPQAKLRIERATPSPGVAALDIRLHERMEVPPDSITVFNEGSRSPRQGLERLESWQTSKGGSVGSGPIEVEAARFGKHVWALVTFLPGVKSLQKRPSSTSTSSAAKSRNAGQFSF
jgi:hypothetical protein